MVRLSVCLNTLTFLFRGVPLLDVLRLCAVSQCGPVCGNLSRDCYM